MIWLRAPKLLALCLGNGGCSGPCLARRTRDARLAPLSLELFHDLLGLPEMSLRHLDRLVEVGTESRRCMVLQYCQIIDRHQMGHDLMPHVALVKLRPLFAP